MAAKIPPRRERRQLDAWAGDLGRACELGAYRRCYGAVRSPARKGLGIFLILGGLLAGVPFAVAAAAQLPLAGAALFGVAGILAALGVVLIKTAPPEKVDWIFSYTGGIAQVAAGAAAPRVVRWELLGQVLKEYEMSEGSEYNDGPSLTVIRVAGVDGTVITADASYGAALGQLDREIDQVVVAMRLPAAMEQCQRGAPVLFGDLSVSREGIAWAHGARQAAWRDIRSVRVSPCQIELGTRGWKMRQRIGLAGVPDSCVAVLLVQGMAARLGVQQKGSPAAVPPPAGEHVAPAGLALLSEADAGEVLGWPMAAVAGLGAGGLAARVFKGGGATLSLAVMNEGAFSAVNRGAGRRFGHTIPGISEEAWLLNGDRTIIVRAGPATVKLTLAGLPPAARAAALIPLARIVAARLAAPPGD